uniref:COP9 signalosome complex subunit 9 n=1 Tax=Heterorhabditis bacteriophora TaxID=37862 RepID=A0A1I7WN55_HETBA
MASFNQYMNGMDGQFDDEEDDD